MNKKIIIGVIITLILITTLYIIYSGNPKIILYGSKNITIKINTEYNEPGYKTLIRNKDITEHTKVNSNLNTNKIGEYTIYYEINYNNKKAKKIRNIKVIDDTKPTITLLENGNLEICPNEIYKNTNYIAFDKNDGDITDKVKITFDNDKIVYSVENSLGNKFSITKNIIKKDNIKPEIELYGEKEIFLFLGEQFIEPGFKAIDNCDGDITNNVNVKSNLNVNKVGKYKIEYSAKDKCGNEEIIERYIEILREPNSNQKTIYLTFDDGPSNTTTEILDILKKENIKATFFIVNPYQKYEETIKRAFNEGHTIGLHSYSHKYNEIYKNEESYFNDLNLISKKAETIIGIKPNIIRFPGGSSNTIAKRGIMKKLIKKLEKEDYIYFDWNIDSGDAKNISSKTVYKKVITQLEKYNYKTNIILMHDYFENNKTVEALKDIIAYGKENGYTFEKITTLTPQIKHNIKK